MHLTVRKVFEEAITYQSRDILPIVIALVGQFLLQHGSDRNDGRKAIAEEHELKKECPTQRAKRGCQKSRRETGDFDDRRQQFKKPQIWKCKTSDAAVTRTEKHVPVRP